MTGFLKHRLVVLLHFKHGGRLKQDDFETKMSKSIVWQCNLIPGRVNLGLKLLRVRWDFFMQLALDTLRF